MDNMAKEKATNAWLSCSKIYTFIAACCKVTFGPHVHGVIYYRLAMFFTIFIMCSWAPLTVLGQQL